MMITLDGKGGKEIKVRKGERIGRTEVREII
jgi:hypothetical protein